MSRPRNLALLILAFGIALLIHPASAPADVPVLTPLEETTLWGAGFIDNFAIDGDYAVIGDPQYDSQTGKAYVLKKSGQSWAAQQQLPAPAGVSGDQFGESADIDGDTVVIGAWGREGYTGSVYVFVRTGTTWTLQATLNATDRLPGDEFGYSVAVDGDRIVVGASGRGEYGYLAGMVYVFERVGTTWSQTAKIRPPSAQANFGTAVALDGDTMVASPGTFVFVHSGTQWIQQAALGREQGGPAVGWMNGRQGSLDLERDTLVVARCWDGEAHVFERTGSTWTRTATLTGTPSTTFGGSVSLAGDYLAVGAPWDDTGGENRGAVYSYHRTGSTWSPVFKGVYYAWWKSCVGWAVAVDGPRILSDSGNGILVYGIPPDTTPPITAALGVPAGWVREDVSVTLAANDSGTGVTSTFYSLDSALPSVYSSPFSISREGTSSISYWSVDASGNIESANTAYVRIDRSSPDRMNAELSAWVPAGCTLSWSAGRDDVSGISGYRIYRNGSLIATTTALTWSDSGLAPSTAYQYRVSAVDMAGNESANDAVIRYITPHAAGEPVVVEVPASGGTAVPLPGGGSVRFDDPGTGGQLEIAPVTENRSHPDFRVVRGAYYDIHPNFTFSGDAYVTLPYDPADVAGNAERLKLFHWKDGGWEDITVSIDTVNHTITGCTTSFSEFSLGETEPSQPVEVGTPASSGWSLGIAALIMAFMIVSAGKDRRLHSRG